MLVFFIYVIVFLILPTFDALTFCERVSESCSEALCAIWKLYLMLMLKERERETDNLV